MNVFQIISLVLEAVQELEKLGVIKIGGFDPNSVDAVLSSIGLVIKKLPNSGGYGQSTPPGIQN